MRSTRARRYRLVVTTCMLLLVCASGLAQLLASAGDSEARVPLARRGVIAASLAGVHHACRPAATFSAFDVVSTSGLLFFAIHPGRLMISTRPASNTTLQRLARLETFRI